MLLDDESHLFLTRGGWAVFVEEYGLHEGWILKFRYRGQGGSPSRCSTIRCRTQYLAQR
jgi:hypothetical protein